MQRQGRVIVVGGGLAGISAACELLEHGCSVTIIERESNLGGNSSKATTGIAAPGMQLTSGVQDTAEDLLSQEGPEGRAMIKEGPKDVQWLTRLVGATGELVVRLTPGHKVARTLGTKTHFPGAVVTYAAIHLLEQVANHQPERVEILTDARVTKLLQTGSQVTGVEFLQNGVSGSRSGPVVLATGGFSGDLSPTSLLVKHAPTFTNFPATSDERSSGDAIRLGQSVGAAFSNLDKIQLTPMAATLPGQEASEFRITLSDALCGAGGKLIDATGRCFCSELGSAQSCVDAMQKGKGPFRLVISEENAAKVEWMVNFYAQRKVMQSFNNATELAKNMGVSSLDPSIAPNGKLFVATVTPALYTCGGGLNTSMTPGSQGRVLTNQGTPIDGLFAAGEATSVPFQRLWAVSGIPLLHAIHTGRQAGKAAAALAGGSAQNQDLRDLFIASMTAPAKVAANASVEAKTDEKKLEDMSVEELVAKVKELQANPPKVAAAPAGDAGITTDEVKKHNKKDDAWIIVNGQVLDVTKWIPIHPGGEQVIEAFLGQDASEEWNAIHKPGTIEKNLVEKGGKGPWLVGKLGADGGGGGGAVATKDGGLTMADVAKHTAESDMWVLINGKAYDVTKWAQVHPGGVQAITAYAGKDASDEWNAIHKPGTIEKNMFPGNPNGPVDKGPVSGASAAPVAAGAIDDTPPPPDGNGGIGGLIGAIVFLAKNIIVMLLRTVFFTGNFKVDNNRTGTIRSACFLLTFTIIHVAGNFVGMIKGPLEANGEGHFFDRLAPTGGFGIWKEGPAGMSAVELYLAFALVLHVSVALQRSWEISMNYTVSSGRWNMLLSGLTVLSFLTKHLHDIRFTSHMSYTMLRPPPYFVAFSGLLEGRVFYETDTSIPEVRVRDIYTREVDLFKDPSTVAFYTFCILLFWAHMCLGWKKLVPADAMQIPKDHVKTVTILGQVAATAIVSMYLSVLWYTYVAVPEVVQHVP